jgi:hypothetical protein
MMSKEAITDFQDMLRLENWGESLQQKDVNKGFNIFLIHFCIFLKLAFLCKMLLTKQRTTNG